MAIFITTFSNTRSRAIGVILNKLIKSDQTTDFILEVPPIRFPNLKNLGLEIIDIMVEIQDDTNYQLLLKICTQHPYTAFVAFCYGKTNGMFIQYRIPQSTGNFIDELFCYLTKTKIIS